MPNDLGEIPSAAPENEKIATVWVTLQTLLNLQGQPPHATAHVGMARRDPNPTARWNGNHDRSAVSTRRNAARLTSRPTRTCRPSPSSISIRSERAGERVDDEVRSDSSADDSAFIYVSKTRTGTNAGVSISRRVPSRI